MLDLRRYKEEGRGEYKQIVSPLAIRNFTGNAGVELMPVASTTFGTAFPCVILNRWRLVSRGRTDCARTGGVPIAAGALSFSWSGRALLARD